MAGDEAKRTEGTFPRVKQADATYSVACDRCETPLTPRVRDAYDGLCATCWFADRGVSITELLDPERTHSIGPDRDRLKNSTLFTSPHPLRRFKRLHGLTR